MISVQLLRGMALEGGYGKYVSESTGIKITGENVLQFPIEEEMKYVLRDAELVVKLIERNNYEILNIMWCIANIAGLDLKLVCHAGVGKAWESIINKMIQIGECQRPLLNCNTQKLEDQIFPTIIDDAVMLTGTHYSTTANKGNDINNNDKKSNNMQRNESLDKYRSPPQSLVMLSLQA